VGTSVVLGASLLGSLVGALVGGSGITFKITGGFRSIEHRLAVKASNSKIPDDPTMRRAKMTTERNMVIATVLLHTSYKYPVSRNKTVRVLSILVLPLGYYVAEEDKHLSFNLRISGFTVLVKMKRMWLQKINIRVTTFGSLVDCSPRPKRKPLSK
jgi:hypothetical protein